MLNKILSRFNQLFALWVVIGGASAYFFPDAFIPLKKYLDFLFAITMFGVGMVLDPRAFVDIIKNFKIVLVGVVSQYTIMPGLALLFSTLFAFPDDFKLGLILAGSAPGAMASNVLSYLAGADVAYSVSLTTASTLLCPLLTPLLTLLLTKTMLAVPFWSMFINVVSIVVLPLLFGIGVKSLLHEKVNPIIKIFPAISTLFIIFICALVIALNKHYLANLTIYIFLATILLNISGLSIGYAVGHVFGFEVMRKRALSIEIGMQNAGLGSVLALKHFNERAALPAVIFVFVCIFSASLLAPLWSKQKQGI
jgi:bile acid:Na+ symporter, BASS family